ncbi:MAG TPA: hypothetical protein VF011_00520 [Terriglobales bacterium]
MTRSLPFAWILLLLAGVGAQPSTSSSELPAFLYTSAPKYEALAWMRRKDRFPRGAKLFVADKGRSRQLLPEFFASSDPSLSFDGTRVLFAAKKNKRDHWQVWELSLSGSIVRRITSCARDCIRPFYVPDDRFVFAEMTPAGMAIKLSQLSGGQSLPLTYGIGNFLPSDILRDGRILFDAALGLNASGSPEIYTVYSDGSGVESYRCDHGRARHSGRQLASGDVAFAEESGLGRFTSALAHELAITIPSQEYAGDLAELSNGDWLIAARSRGETRFEISRWTPGTPDMHGIVSDRQADLVQPVAIMTRPVPNRHPSGLHDWSYANLLCLNAYTSKTHFSAGSIASVRLYTRNAAGREAPLGSTGVEPDGSFYLRVPADQPLKLEMLDAAGKSLQKEGGWFWLRKGEQRICVGCHAGPETAPENAVPAVLLRSTVATDMTSSAAHTASGGH